MTISKQLSLLLVLFAVYVISSCTGDDGQLMGGFTRWKAVDAETSQLAKQLKSEVQTKSGQTYSMYKPVRFKSQVVAGTNYKIKIKVSRNPGEFIVIKAFQPLPYTNEGPQLTSVRKLKRKAKERMHQ